MRIIGGELRKADLNTEQELPDDVKAEVAETWDAFVDVFGPRRRCFSDVSLLLVREVEDGDARYVVDGAVIEIQIPTSPRRFRESLVHELAHHVEYTCASFGVLRAGFAGTLGVPVDQWFSGEDWEDVPSEKYAEAVVEVVNSERVRHVRSMPLEPELLGVVRSWARAE